MKVKERVERLVFRTVLSVKRLIHEEKAENFVDTAIKNFNGCGHWRPSVGRALQAVRRYRPADPDPEGHGNVQLFS